MIELEPNWMKQSMADLIAAERHCNHRISGGETVWLAVRARVRAAMKSYSEAAQKNRERIKEAALRKGILREE